MLGWPPSWSRLLLLPALFLAFTVHELAHALVAFLLGDTSQVERGRLSFNPLRHVSVFGMIAFLLVGFGWAKPVWVDHARLRTKNRALGVFLVSVSGAAANLLVGLLALLGLSVTLYLVWAMSGAPWEQTVRFLFSPATAFDAQGLAVALSYYVVMVNVILALFNLIPLPPLDGFQAAVSLINMAMGILRRHPGGQVVGAQPTSVLEGTSGATSAAWIHFDIGLQYHRQGQIDEAIARYRRAIEQDERFGLAYYNLGLAYWARGKWDQANGMLKVASQAASEPALRMQAERRLRELLEADREGGPIALAVPSPLGLADLHTAVAGGPSGLDPVAARRLWLRLALGSLGLLVLAVFSWLFVTLMALAALGSG